MIMEFILGLVLFVGINVAICKFVKDDTIRFFALMAFATIILLLAGVFLEGQRCFCFALSILILSIIQLLIGIVFNDCLSIEKPYMFILGLFSGKSTPSFGLNKALKIIAKNSRQEAYYRKIRIERTQYDKYTQFSSHAVDVYVKNKKILSFYGNAIEWDTQDPAIRRCVADNLIAYANTLKAESGVQKAEKALVEAKKEVESIKDMDGVKKELGI